MACVSCIEWETFVKGLKYYKGPMEGPALFRNTRDNLLKEYPEMSTVNFKFIVSVTSRRGMLMHKDRQTEGNVADLVKEINEFEYMEGDPDEEKAKKLAEILGHHRSEFR